MGLSVLELHEEISIRNRFQELELLKVVILIVMLIIPSIDLVGVDVAITIDDEVFDKDLKNKSSSRNKKLEEQVEQEVRK